MKQNIKYSLRDCSGLNKKCLPKAYVFDNIILSMYLST